MALETFDFLTESVKTKPGFPVLISESEDSTEQRRLVTDKLLCDFEVTGPPMTDEQLEEVWQFFLDHNGPFEAFIFKNRVTNQNFTVRFTPNDGVTFSTAGGVKRYVAQFNRTNQIEGT